MTPLSQKEFLRAVLRSGLLERPLLEQRVREFQASSPPDPQSTERLAAFLVRGGDLTQYQAKRLLAGRTEGFFVGHCKVLDRLGAGGMGTVYRAEQVKLGRQVALKVLPERFVRNAKAVARFQREARAVARLKHPNVVQIYDVGQEGQTHFIIMELIQGVNLCARMEQGGPLSVAEALDVIEQAARGLQHAHEHKIIHRDVKPSNLVLEGKTVKLLDLGLALRADTESVLTQDAKGMGTPDYMSPEQFTDAHQADSRSDLYSLGCTWYHLLAGRTPFAGMHPLAKGVAHLQGTAEPIQDLRADVPAEVAATIEKLMAKNPDDRYQTAGELLADLERFRTTGEATLTPSLPATVKTPAARPAPPVPAARPASQVSLTPAERDSHETLIRSPSGAPMLLLYLLPVMAALVLGGVYLGIQLFRDRLLKTEPLVVATPPVTDPRPKPVPKTKTPVAEKPTPQPIKPPKPVTRPLSPKEIKEVSRQLSSFLGSATANPLQGLPLLVVKSDDLRPAPPPPPRLPRTWLVGDGKLSFESAWKGAEDGDRLEVSQASPISVGELRLSGKHLTVAGIASARPILLFDLPAVPQSGRGLWQVERGSLTLERVDLFVNLTRRKVDDTEVVLLQLKESNLRLFDATVTVVRGAVQGRSPVTFVKVAGERAWDPKARGEPPLPVLVEFRNSFLRGVTRPVYLNSLQADVRLENCLVCSPGPLIQLFHTRKREFEHQRLRVEVGSCTLDTLGPIVSVECRPYEWAPRLEIKMTSTLAVSSETRKDARPPIVCWEKPIEDKVLSTALSWRGQSNSSFQRGDCLKAKLPQGPWATFVEGPEDWLRRELGEDNGHVNAKSIVLPIGPWHLRLASSYPPYRPTVQGPPRGADPKQLPESRRLPGT